MKRLIILSLLFFSFSCGSEGLRVEKYTVTETETIIQTQCDLNNIWDYCEEYCMLYEGAEGVKWIKINEDLELQCKCKD